MNILQIISRMPRRTIRCLSLANLTIPPLICFFLGSGNLVHMMLYNVCISISIVLMISDIYNDWQTSLTFASFTFLVSVVLSVAFSMGFSTILVSLGYVFVASFPLALCLTIRTIRVMKDIGFLTIRISGWEILLCLIKYSFLAFFMVAEVFSVFCSAFGEEMAAWIPRTILFLASALYALIYLRNMVSGPVIGFSVSGAPSSGKDAEIGAFVPEVSMTDNRTMYNRMCRYIEDKKPFLDPAYALEELAKALFSNKAYISKMINSTTGLNFSQFMNRYRVNYARELYANDMDLKVKDLSDMSGFHSQVSFNMAFRLFYDITPGAWCKEYKDTHTAHAGKEAESVPALEAR